MKWLRRALVLGAAGVLLFPVLMSTSTVSAELSEAEKQAIERAREEEKQAAEDQEDQQAPEPPPADEAAPPEEPASQEDVELTEAEKKAIEAAKKAAENQQGGQDQGQGGDQAATDTLKGYISAIGSDSLSVGIIGDSTVKVTGRTYVTYNGQPSNLPRLFIGDTVSVKRDLTTGEAISIEAEGYGFPATYQGVGVTVTYIGLIGHIPGRSWGMHAGGAGLKLGPATQVTINGVPATYQDLRVGDTIDYVQSAVDLKALWVAVTR